VQSLQTGAADFIEKPFAASDLVARIGRVTARSRPAAQDGAALHFENGLRLTRRERQVLDHLLAGSTSKVIARQLGVSPRTVEEHRSNIMRKAGVKSVAQLMVAALEAARGSERASPGSRAGTQGASHQAHVAHAANGPATLLATC
jgi:FixJ family two-component response regulator